MKHWATEIKAIDPNTGELMTYAGPNIQGISMRDAMEFCENNGLGYCKVVYEINSEIPYSDGVVKWDDKQDYRLVQLN